MNIENNLKAISAELPETVALVAVSKTKSEAEIMQAYTAGQRIFGENKVQEMVQKWEGLPKDIEWHMIGHVQRNKVKYMAEFVALIHGVDSLKLLKEIDKQARKHQRVINCLMQVHISGEETKFGFDATELRALFAENSFEGMQNIKIVGLMGMATFTDDEDQIRREFRDLKSLYDDARKQIPTMDLLSMGMSGDFKIAIEEGSNMVRIGSSIFGARNY